MAAPASSPEFRDRSEPQDWSSLRAWLESRGRHLDDVAPRQFAGGLANLNYLISVDGAPVVLRRPPSGELAEGASDMDREARVLTRLAGSYPLAPRSIAFCADRAVIGAEFQLIEYRAGVTMGDRVPAGLHASGTDLTRGYVAAMAGLHAIDPAAAGLADLGRRPERFLTRQVDGWERRAGAAYGGEPPAAVGEIIGWLRDREAPPFDVRLLHNDFKFDNLILDPATGKPAAVVDWDMSTLGDPLFDLAVALSYWVEPGDPAALHELGQAPSFEPGFPGRAEVARMYFDAAGREPVALGFHMALARLRLAIAWQQMFVLHERGALAGARYATFDGVAREMLAFAAESLHPELN